MKSEELEIAKDSRLMKKLIKSNTGIRYNWEDVKKELFKNIKASPSKKSKKAPKKPGE